MSSEEKVSKEDIKLFISESEDLIQKTEEEIFKIEERPDDIYVKQVIQLAGVIWEESPNTEVALSVNVGRNFWTEQYKEGMLRIAKFVHKQNKSEKLILDAHEIKDQLDNETLIAPIGMSVKDYYEIEQLNALQRNAYLRIKAQKDHTKKIVTGDSFFIL